MKQYLALCQRIVDEGTMIHNKRTGHDTLTVINADLEYNVANGEFPMVTTRKSFFKSAVAELLGYIRGYDSAADFRAIGTKTWDANANENKAWLSNPARKGPDDMGLAYRFRNKGYFEKMPSAIREYPEDQKIGRVFDLRNVDYSKNDLNLVGEQYTSNGGFDFVVLREKYKEDTKTNIFDIQFIESGYTKKDVLKSEIIRKEVKDPYSPVVQNIGCMGDLSGLDEALISLLKPFWNNMITRCYGNNHEHDKTYRTVFVSDEWLIFENFVKDFKSIPNWELKQVFPQKYSLDKDFYNSNYYSKSTVRWATKKEQSVNSKSTNTFLAKNIESGEEVYFKGAREFAQLNNLPQNFANLFSNKEKGDTFVYHDWEITIIDHKSIRYIEVDQFREVYAKLKLGLDDRRLIIDAWYPHTAGLTCLMPCMYSHTFSLLGDTLYLTSYQRSCDVPLGLNFNMVQVYALLAIMAQITGKKPGKAYHKIVNAHIYDNQIELMKDVQLKREPLGTPTFKINPDIKSLEDLETWVTKDDFTVEGYECHDPIKYPFAV